MPIRYLLNPKIKFTGDRFQNWMDSWFTTTPSLNSQRSYRFQWGEGMLSLSDGLTSPTKNRRACTHGESTAGSGCLFNRPQFLLSNLGSSQGTPPHPPPHPRSWNAGGGSQESHFTGPKQLKQSKLALDLLHIRSSHTLWNSSVLKKSKNC